MPILVFKTNIENFSQIRKIRPLLKKISEIQHWNVDLNDTDRILRVEAKTLTPFTIEKVLVEAGYFCRELED